MHIAVILTDAHHATRVLEHGKERQTEDAELAAVRMPRQRERHAAMRRRIVDELRMMREQNGNSVTRNIRHRLSEIRLFLRVKSVAACKRIVHTCDVECTAPSDMLRRVQHDMDAPFALHTIDERARVPIVFVIADAVIDAVAEISDVCSEHLGGTLVQRLIVEQIPRHSEEIGAAARNLREQRIEVVHGEVRTEMHVADLRDHHAVRLGWQITYRDYIVTPYRLMPFNECTVAAEEKARRRIEHRIFEHTSPLCGVRNAACFAPEEPQEDGNNDEAKGNQLPHEKEDDGQRKHPRPPVRLMGAEQIVEQPHAPEFSSDEYNAQDTQPPPRCQIAQRVQAQSETGEHDEQENHKKAGQFYLLSCQSPVIMETSGIVATEISVESAMISVMSG